MKILTLTGPTCSGKSSIERILAKDYGYGKVISHTTREPRKGETDGVDYHFCNHEFFNEHLSEFLEFITYEGTNYYGVHSSEIARLSQVTDRMVIVVEPNGARQIAQWCALNNAHHIPVFLRENSQLLYERLLERFIESGDTAKQASRRFATLAKELQWATTETTGDFPWCIVPTMSRPLDFLASEIHQGVFLGAVVQ